MRFPLIYVLLLSLSLPLRASESIGTKVTMHNPSSGNSTDMTEYWESDRRRREYRNSSGDQLGPHLVSITRCDLGKIFELNLDSSQYESAPYPPKPLTKKQMQARGLDQEKVSLSEKPTIRIEIKTVDTGERKQMFGHSARHVITTRKETPLGGSDFQPQESVQDGWYIDLPLDREISCDPYHTWRKQHGAGYATYLEAVSFPGAGRQVIDKPEFVTDGKPETGFALQLVARSENAYKLPDGTVKHSRFEAKTIVTEFQEGPLDPALFEVPHGFKQVKQIERYPALQDANPIRDFWGWVKYTVANWF